MIPVVMTGEKPPTHMVSIGQDDLLEVVIIKHDGTKVIKRVSGSEGENKRSDTLVTVIGSATIFVAIGIIGWIFWLISS